MNRLAMPLLERMALRPPAALVRVLGIDLEFAAPPRVESGVLGPAGPTSPLAPRPGPVAAGNQAPPPAAPARSARARGLLHGRRVGRPGPGS
jgi:hypothetical protein